MNIREKVLASRWVNTTIYNTEDIQSIIINIHEFLARSIAGSTGLPHDLLRNVPDEFYVLTTASADRAVVEAERDYTNDRSPKVTIGLVPRPKMMVTDLERMGALSEHATVPLEVIGKLVRAYMLAVSYPEKYKFYGLLNNSYGSGKSMNYTISDEVPMKLPFVQGAQIRMGTRPAGAAALESVIRAKEQIVSTAHRLNALTEERDKLATKVADLTHTISNKRDRLVTLQTRLNMLYAKHPELKEE